MMHSFNALGAGGIISVGQSPTAVIQAASVTVAQIQTLLAGQTSVTANVTKAAGLVTPLLTGLTSAIGQLAPALTNAAAQAAINSQQTTYANAADQAANAASQITTGLGTTIT